MIPKIIHYCWFGGNELPEKAKKCIESWQKFCPDYEIKRWSEDNYQFDSIRFLQKAAADGKWSFVTDYVRLDVVYQHGGIYLDTDVELIKPIDDLLKYKAFFGFETNETINTGLGYGAEAGYEPLRQMMEKYKLIPELVSEEQYINNTCPKVQTPYIAQEGFGLNGKDQTIDNVRIFSKEYLCPLNYQTGELAVTENTISIHWYAASWRDEADRKVTEMRQKLTPMLGMKNAWRAAVLIQYTRYKGIKETFRYYLKKIH